ncbi:MAG TPA: PHP domain-containing protein [Solirubrobacteraceae bacterium]|nr:PHP domain-containing protein [Solirubrobacteraceae bacterium]
MSASAAPTFDLQSHSVHSDGALAPAEVVAGAAAAGVTLFALTDHDTTDGVGEASDAADDVGIRLVPATEISASFGGQQDLHILGYLIDPGESALVTALARSRHDREHRVEAMIDALTGLGFAVDHEMLARRTAQGQSVGRPHLAQAVVSRPENRERLRRAGLLDPTAFLVEYLIEGKPAFVPRAAPEVRDAIALIHGAGGLAVWAHPFWDIDADRGVLDALDEFHHAGLDGVEAFYVSHTEAQTRLLVERGRELGLLTTGSSDFHGPDHHTFSAFRAFSTYGLEPVLGPLAG